MRLRGRPQAAEGPQGRVGRENFGPDGNGGGGARRVEGRSPSQAAGGRRSRPPGGSLRAGACGLQGVAEEAEAGRRQGRPAGRPRRAKPVGPGEAGAPAARGPVDAEMCRGAGNCYRKVNSVPGRFPGGERCGIMGSKNAGEPMLPLVLEPKRKAFYGDLDFLPRPDAGGRGMERKKGGNSL